MPQGRRDVALPSPKTRLRKAAIPGGAAARRGSALPNRPRPGDLRRPRPPVRHAPKAPAPAAAAAPGRPVPETNGDGLSPFPRGLAPKAPDTLPTANRRDAGPIPPAWPGGSRPPPAPRSAAARAVLRASCRERLSPRRLRQEQFPQPPGYSADCPSMPRANPRRPLQYPGSNPAGHTGHPRPGRTSYPAQPPLPPGSVPLQRPPQPTAGKHDAR